MKLIQSLSKSLLPFLFTVVLFLPFFNNLFNIWEFERKDENRAFNDSLSINIQKLDKFPAEADSFMSDNFSFRTPLLDIYQNMKYNYFSISPYPEKTIIGKDGWLFKSAEEKKIYEGKMNFTEEELQALLKKWEYRKAYFDSLNIKAYWLIAPFKHNVYPEKLPFNVLQAERRVDVLKKRFDEKFPELIIDPVPQLIEAKKEKKVYYKLDNHWNYKAGEIVSELLLKRFKEDFSQVEFDELPIVTWKDTVRKLGFHRTVLGIEELQELRHEMTIENPQAKQVEKYGFPPLKWFAYPHEYELRYVKENAKSGLKILVIRDSFGTFTMPFIAELFNESVFVFDAWRYGLNKPIVETVKPDIVLYLGLETHINNMMLHN